MASTGLRFQSVGREICAKAWKGTLSMRPERSIDDVRTIEESERGGRERKGDGLPLFYSIVCRGDQQRRRRKKRMTAS